MVMIGDWWCHMMLPVHRTWFFTCFYREDPGMQASEILPTNWYGEYPTSSTVHCVPSHKQSHHGGPSIDPNCLYCVGRGFDLILNDGVFSMMNILQSDMERDIYQQFQDDEDIMIHHWRTADLILQTFEPLLCLMLYRRLWIDHQ